MMREWREGWTRAEKATETLKEALASVGAPEEATRRLRPLVSDRGTPWVDVGAIPAHLAEHVAEVLRLAQDAGLGARGR